MKMDKDKKHSPHSAEKTKEYLYTTAGLREREGHIPIWLICLGVGLFIWGTFYLIKFWSLP